MFTIAELGFGTGLNFLATWQMWRDHRPADGWLNFVSFEGYPRDREDVARALTPWPELSDLVEQLCAALLKLRALASVALVLQDVAPLD